MTKVIRVFGRADSFDIEFKSQGDAWVVDVPPDMTDGVYAVQLTAIDENNVRAFHVGELYMVNGICCFRLRELPYRAYFKVHDYEFELHHKKYNVSFEPLEYLIDFEKRYNVQIKKKKHQEPRYKMEFGATLKTSRVTKHFSSEVKTASLRVIPKTNFYTEYEPKTKIFIGKECLGHGGK